MHRTRSALAVALAAALAALAVAPQPVRADDAVAEIARDAPVAAFGGWTAWSAYDSASRRYALTLRDPSGTTRPAPLPASSRPWDVSLGPAAGNAVVAVYTACTATGCDVRRLDVAAGTVTKLPQVSSPGLDEANPAIWRSTVAFTRRIGGCDVPYVRDLGSRAPSRRLLRAKCLQTAAGHLSLRGTRLFASSVDRSGADAHGAGRKVAEVRRYATRGGGSEVLLRQTFGEEANLFGQVAQDEAFAWTVRTGSHGPSAFVRVRTSGGRQQEVPARQALTGAFAKPTAASSVAVAAQEAAGCDGFTDVPCRLVQSATDPFGSVVHQLAPQLTVAYAGRPVAGQPLTFSGRLTRTRVAGGEVLAADPVAGVTVDLRARTGADPERFVPTGLTATTAADGTWSITLPALAGDPYVTAVAATPGVATWAGRGTVGYVPPAG